MVCVWNPQNRFKNIKTCNFYKGNYKNAKGIQIICPINPFVGPVYGEPMEDLMFFFNIGALGTHTDAIEDDHRAHF